MMKKNLVLLAALVLVGTLAHGRTAALAAASPDSLKALEPLLGVPYRADGAYDNGRYTLFADHARSFSTPGLNCSGLTARIADHMFGRATDLDGAARDRLGDSGPTVSPGAGGRAAASTWGGPDWDFGWDIILNLTDGQPRRWLLPGGKTADPSDPSVTGWGPLGYDLHAPESLPELLGRVQKNKLYLVSFSKAVARKPYSLQHYHVAAFLKDDADRVWIYQTTKERGQSYRMNLSDQAERKKFLQYFANTGRVRKHILVLEADLPEL